MVRYFIFIQGILIDREAKRRKLLIKPGLIIGVVCSEILLIKENLQGNNYENV